MTDPVVRPMPLTQGFGFFSPTGPLPENMVKGYRHEVVGRFNNYHVTPQAWKWPAQPYSWISDKLQIIDAFSPNIDKDSYLHVGHLRQLILATSLQRLMPQTRTIFVALLGASRGVRKHCMKEFKHWTNFTGYKPEVYYDVLMPVDVVPTRPANPGEFDIHEDPFGTPEVWDGPFGPVLVKRSDGRTLYAYHDLVFAEEVKPTHYITDHGQREHFKVLGLLDKHLPMGLVLGQDAETQKWTKLKTRSGDAMTLVEALLAVQSRLLDTDHPEQLAWNVLAWNFLHVSRGNDVKFEVEKWTNPDSPGLYITYTWARINKALKVQSALEYELWEIEQFMGGSDFHQIDLEILSLADQHHYWRLQAWKNIDPTTLAGFAHDLARKLGTVYHQERIDGGRQALRLALLYANTVLKKVMVWLGMFPLTDV
jgi:arginyl-tRNA synthetase